MPEQNYCRLENVILRKKHGVMKSFKVREEKADENRQQAKLPVLKSRRKLSQSLAQN